MPFPDNRPDVELFELAVAGDESAFLVLYDRMKTPVFRYAYYMTGSKSSAEEVTQEVFLTLLQKRARFNPRQGDLGAFIFGIARNLVRRIDRRERPYEPLPDDADSLAPPVRTVAECSTDLIKNQAVEHVRSAVASLPEHYRQVVVLCDLLEMSYADTATRLGCAVGTVRSRLNRAHKLLAGKLKLLRESQPAFRNTGTEGCLI
ncbi:MAG TPA: RNA polymerase sigma factor [Terriglobales bacterium]|nr:RNA polymerase sigma factor [Terriglobales bacterium]